MRITRSRNTGNAEVMAEEVAEVKPKPWPQVRAVVRGVARRAPVGSAAPEFLQMKNRAKDDIAAKLKLISQAYADIDEATAKIDEASKVIEARLKSVNMTEYSDGVLKACIEETFSRQSTYIDPKKFRAAVESDAFWSSIKVLLEEASKHLSKTELARISDVTPGKRTGTRFTVKPVDKKRGG